MKNLIENKNPDSPIKAILILLCILIIIAFVTTLFIGFAHPTQVKAAGTTTVTVTMNTTTSMYGFWQTGGGIWSDLTAAHSASFYNTSLMIGYGAQSPQPDYYLDASAVSFNISGLGIDPSTVTGIQVKLFVHDKYSHNSPTFQGPYVALYDTKGTGTDGIYQNVDYDQFRYDQTKNKISNYVAWENIPAIGQWQTFTINTNDIAAVLTPKNGHCQIEICSEEHALNQIPAGNWGPNAANYMVEYGSAGAEKAQLVITYVGSAKPPSFIPPVNDPKVDPSSISGNETADNITLYTPSCMYANEDLMFDEVGDPGATVTLQLQDSNGSVLDSVADQIRTNGHYYWINDSLASTYSGFVRVKDTTWGIYSSWVSVQPEYDATEANMMIYAGSTAYPQYTNSFASYVVQQGDYMFVHWKTNINPGIDDLSQIYLDIYDNGDNVTPQYHGTFLSLQSYYGCPATNFNIGIPWRYAVFTPRSSSSVNTYGGLVQNLNLDFSPTYTGYLQPMITQAGAEIVETHSAYWYLSSPADGIVIAVDDKYPKNDDPINVTITIGKQSNVDEYLQYCDISLLENGVSLSSSVKQGANSFTLDPTGADGDYTLRIKLYNSSRTSYQYIFDQTITSSGSGGAPTTTPPGGATATNIWDWIKSILHMWHLDTTFGHWFLILIGMAAGLLIGWKTGHKTVGLMIALLVLGLGIFVGWIDWWWIILLAIGAGFTVWSFIRNKASGGNSSNG